MANSRENELHRARLVASVAATIISLACGTNVSWRDQIVPLPDKHYFPSSPSLTNPLYAVRLLSMGTSIR